MPTATANLTWKSGAGPEDAQRVGLTRGENVVYTFTNPTGSENITGWSIRVLCVPLAGGAARFVRTTAPGDGVVVTDGPGRVFTVTLPNAITASESVGPGVYVLEAWRSDAGEEDRIAYVFLTVSESGFAGPLPPLPPVVTPLSVALGGTGVTSLTSSTFRRALGLPINAVLDFGAVGDGVADDTAELQAAIDATPSGGVLYVPAGTYKLTAALAIADAITIVGDGCVGVHGTITADGIDVMNLPLVSPYLSGTVLVQTAAAANAIRITTVGRSVHLRDFGIRFDGASVRFTNTGHGVFAEPTAQFSGRPEMGLHSSWWERVSVFGHDGNHYAFKVTNQLCCTFRDLRFYGGGGLHFSNNTAWAAGNMGNLQCDHLYGQLFVDGTAHGVWIQQVAGTPNMFQFNRCQVTTNAPNAVFELGASPGGDQYCFFCDPGVRNITWVQADFESGVGGKLRLPAEDYFLDPASLLQQAPEGGPGTVNTANGPQYSWLKKDNYSIRSDLVQQVDVETVGETPKGWYYKPGALYGATMAPDSGAVGNIIATTNPRPSPRKQSIAWASLDTEPHFSNGTNWDDVAAATPDLAALSDIAGLAGDFEVHLLGLSHGAAISTLNDAVAGNHATAAGAARPLYDTTIATPAPGGKASASFDGTNHVMSSALSAGSTSFTDFYVIYVTDVSSNIREIVGSSGGAGIQTRLRNDTSPQGCVDLVKQAALFIGVSTYAIPTGRWCLVTVMYNGTNAEFYVDCTPMGSGSVSTTMAASTTLIGGGTAAKFRGNLARFVRYAAALTIDERRRVWKFLRAWGTLP